MHTHQRSLFLKISLLILIALGSGLLLNIKALYQMQEDRFNQQATHHISMLANGSIDDLLSKDYGDMESWVRATASDAAYAFAFIKSPTGKILIHSELGYTGVQKTPHNIKIPLYQKIHYEDKPVTEIIYPILIEGTLLGTAHLAYYNEYQDNIIRRTLIQLTLLYAGLLFIMLTGLYLILKFTAAKTE